MSTRSIPIRATCLLLAGIVAGALSAPADAAFQVTLRAGAASTTIVDGGALDLDGDANDIINVNTVVGGYTFTSTLAATNTSGTPILSFLNAGTNQISGSGATTVSIYASASGFTAPSSPPALSVVTNTTFAWSPGTTSGNTADVTVRSFYDSSDTLSTSASGLVIGSDSAKNLPAPAGGAYLFDVTTQNFLTTPYALNLELMAVFKSNAVNTADLNGKVEVSPVPEPATLAIWSVLGAGGALVLARRRRRGRWTPQQRSAIEKVIQ